MNPRGGLHLPGEFPPTERDLMVVFVYSLIIKRRERMHVHVASDMSKFRKIIISVNCVKRCVSARSSYLADCGSLPSNKWVIQWYYFFWCKLMERSKANCTRSKRAEELNKMLSVILFVLNIILKYYAKKSEACPIFLKLKLRRGYFNNICARGSH